MEDKTYELMTKMYAEFSNRFEHLENDNIELKEAVASINNTVIKIENEHGDKLSALFDGWKQNTDRLDRIEKEVSRQDEIILRKVK